MGRWVPRSLHHLERARHVCNGLSHASLQTVIRLRKVHTGRGVTNALPQFPTGPVAFSQIDGLEALKHKHKHRRAHIANMCMYEHTRAWAERENRQCLQFLCTVWHLSISVSD